MRTVDPSSWSKTPKYLTTLRYTTQFGQKPQNWREAIIRSSLKKTFLEFCNTTQLKGMRLVTYPTSSEFERSMMRWILLLVLVSGVIITGMLVYKKRQSPALTVALPSLEYDIQKINFPAVALCSFNVLNKPRVVEYARYLFEHKKRTRSNRKFTEEVIIQHLVNFGALIDFDLPNVDIDFMELLRNVDRDKGWNITKLMLHLIEPCSEQLVVCAWRGHRLPCETLFAMRLTQWGFCCVFNGRYHKEDKANIPYRLNKIGSDNGLSVIVKRKQDEQIYSRNAGIGTEVLLFDGDEYPLLEGGGVVSIPASLNRSTFIVLSVKDMEALSEVNDISESRRECQFEEPHNSYIQCLTECRRSTIFNLCGCVPYQLMAPPNAAQCGLNQLRCLNKYSEKMLFYYPEELTEDPGLQEEISNSLDCKCLPDCLRIRYSTSVSISKFQIEHQNKTFRNFFSRGVNVYNTSVIRIYYSTEGQRLYSLELNEKWDELISIIGDLCTLTTGMTLALAPEVLYFITVRWWRNFKVMREQHLRIQRPYKE